MRAANGTRMYRFMSARIVASAVVWFFLAAPCGGAVFAVQFAVQQDVIEVNENQLVSWVFKEGSNLDAAHRAAEGRLKVQVDLATQACKLTASQRTRLMLAGEGDIHRFLNKFTAVRRTIKSYRMSRKEYEALSERMEPLVQEYGRGLHNNDKSLYVKALRTTLDHEQLRRYDDFEQARNRRHYVGMVKGAIGVLENEIPLTAKQRQRLFDVILAQGPPRKSTLNTPYKFYVVLYRVSTIPAEQVRPIFLDNEWGVMTAILQQARDLRPVLEREGVEFD